MAFLTPATCHSFTSRYSLSASAARNDRLRPVLFASFSSRFLTSVSTRKVNVVDVIVVRFLMWLIVYIIARMQENCNRANLDTEPNADGSSTPQAAALPMVKPSKTAPLKLSLTWRPSARGCY